jgi:gamma-glutamylputrescine oxidase
LAVYRAILGAIDDIVAFVGNEKIECGLQRTGAFYCAVEPSHRRIVEREYDALRRNGIPAEMAAPERMPIATATVALRTPNDHALDPAAFLRGCAERFVGHGGMLYEHTSVDRLRRTPGGRVELITPHGQRIRADHAVVATCGTSVPGVPHILTVPFYSYIAVTEPVPEECTARLGDALCWDTYQVTYHYLRRLPDGRMLIGGNDSVRSALGTTSTDRAAKRLVHTLQTYFPGAPFRLQQAWWGRMAVPASEFPSIETSGNLTTLATEGLALSWLLGSAAADRITDGRSSYDGLFDGKRNQGLAVSLLQRAPLPHRAKIALMRVGLAWHLLRSSLDERFIH